MRTLGLFNRLLKAYKEGRPLNLRPGDVMMLRHVLADLDVKSQETFEALAAWGGNKIRWEKNANKSS